MTSHLYALKEAVFSRATLKKINHLIDVYYECKVSIGDTLSRLLSIIIPEYPRLDEIDSADRSTWFRLLRLLLHPDKYHRQIQTWVNSQQIADTVQRVSRFVLEVCANRDWVQPYIDSFAVSVVDRQKVRDFRAHVEDILAASATQSFVPD